MPTTDFWRLMDKAIANQRKLGGYGEFCGRSSDKAAFRAYAQGVEAALLVVQTALEQDNLSGLRFFIKEKNWKEE